MPDERIGCKQQINYNGLDAGKFIMAVIVIAIHTHPFYYCTNRVVGEIWSNIMTLAVPFFFVSASYLFFLNREDIYSEKSVGDLYKRICHFIYMYVLWEVLYLPCVIWEYYNNGYSLFFNVADYIRKFLFVGSNYYSSQLWFVLTMIYALAILYIFLRRRLSLSKILAYSSLLLIIGSVINYLIGIRDDSASGLLWSFVGYLNSLCNGSTVFPWLIYIALGMAMANRRIILSRFVMLLCMAIGVSGQIILRDVYIFYDIFILIEVIAVFQFFLQLRLKNQKICIKLREASKVMFYTHFYFIFLYGLIFPGFPQDGFGIFGICLLCCLVLSSVIACLKEHRQFRWLKTLFG